MENKNYYRGSLDPFEDVVDLLESLNVAFCLMIGMHGQADTLCWTNVGQWGAEAVENFDEAWKQTKEELDND
jgi:hypothetical protein